MGQALGWQLVAKASPIVINMPLYGYVASTDLLEDAESLIAEEMARLLAQGASSEAVEIMVLGDRNGELVPILMTVVSPAQWQQDPQVSRWSQYYDSYALLGRYDQGVVAIAPRSFSGSQPSAPFQAPVRQIEAAADTGRLSGELAQEYLDELD
ncbi:MAG: hypothetical protein F6K30_30215 [Cyanothece sp. SIO2G6]|nr:hypothetical protein [Cyanothece sp. SIO2G6]